MKRILAIVLLFAALGLSACTTTQTPESPLRKMQLSGVNIRYLVGADYQVAAIEKEYINSQTSVPALKRVFESSTPEGQAYLRAGIEAHLKPHLVRRLSPVLTGTNPVTAEIRVQKIWVPGVLRGALINEGFYMNAVFALVDNVTGIDITTIGPIQAIYDGAIQIGGAKIPQTGISKKLSDIGDDFALKAVQRLQNEYSGQISN